MLDDEGSGFITPSPKHPDKNCRYTELSSGDDVLTGVRPVNTAGDA